MISSEQSEQMLDEINRAKLSCGSRFILHNYIFFLQFLGELKADGKQFDLEFVRRELRDRIKVEEEYGRAGPGEFK